MKVREEGRADGSAKENWEEGEFWWNGG